MNLKCFIGFFFIISSVCNAEVTSDLWHREFVQSWNEWQRTQKVPPYLAKNDLLKTLMKKVKDSAKYKQEDKNAPSYLLASTSSGIVNFTSTTKTFPRSIVEVEKDKTQHRLTIRLLKWPKFLMNGNTFEYYPKQSIKENLTHIKNTHHYQKLKIEIEKNEFALAALSYMSAMRMAGTEIQIASELRMQRPNPSKPTNKFLKNDKTPFDPHNPDNASHVMFNNLSAPSNKHELQKPTLWDKIKSAFK